jgi:hypothetical protein
MKSARHVSFVMATGLVFVGLSAMATPQPEPSGAASAATSASAAASASSSARAPRMPPPEPLDKQSIPKEASKVPTVEEWKSATPVAFTRRSTDAKNCRAFRVREWLKVKCEMIAAVIKQHGGSPENVFFWAGPHDGFEWHNINGGQVIFPMRPGDQRVIQFFSLEYEQCFGRQSWPGPIVDEIWIEGDSHPTVVIR